jgi:DNA-binding PadR family transcriptional regulator
MTDPRPQIAALRREALYLILAWRSQPMTASSIATQLRDKTGRSFDIDSGRAYRDLVRLEKDGRVQRAGVSEQDGVHPPAVLWVAKP